MVLVFFAVAVRVGLQSRRDEWCLDLYSKELEAMTNPGDTSKGSSSRGNGWLFGVGVVLVWGAVLELRDWWVVNGERVRLVGIWVLGVAAVLLVAMAVVGVWAGRSDGLAGGRGLAGGWDAGRRVRIMVMRAAGGTRRPGGGLVQQRRRGDPAVECVSGVLRQAAGLPVSERVVRVVWARLEGKWVWGVSVDRELGASVERSVGSFKPPPVARGPG